MVFWTSHIYVVPQRSPYGLAGFKVLAMHREVRQPDPEGHCFWGVSFRIEVRSPPVKVKTLQPHEIGPISEDQLFIILGFKVEEEKTLPDGVGSNNVGD